MRVSLLLAKLTIRPMTCPICGNESPCTHDRPGIPLSATALEQPEIREAPQRAIQQSAPHDSNWRKEVASRVQQHRVRRGRNSDAGSSMEFDFSAEEAISVTQEPVVTRERFRHSSFGGYALPMDRQPDSEQPQQEFHAHEYPKVIRFPRSIPTAPGNLAEELAVEVDLSPRIVYAADQEMTVQYETDQPVNEEEEVFQSERMEAQPLATQMDLLPSFEDIRLESGHNSVKIESEVVPQPAAMQKRLFAGAVDMAAVFLAAVLFKFTFGSLAEDDPHTRVAALCGLCVAGILWTLFQYIFLVYGKGTPGMRIAELELATFEGKTLDARARRWRTAASTLSALSLGFGYAWMLVDEDQLSWHDRITRTLVKVSGQPSTDAISPWD